MNTGIEHQGGVGVPQVVEVDMGQSRLTQGPGEGMCHSAGIEWPVASVAEDEVGFLERPPKSTTRGLNCR